jgi:DNA-binding NtrC family response regulator
VLRVLLVDDEVAFTSILSKVLRRRGIEVEVRNCCDGVVDRVLAGGVDVVVLDVKMPGRSGLELLADIKKGSPRTGVILMTGHLSISDEADGLAIGAFAYLLKPHPIADLVERVEAAAASALSSAP